MDPQTPQKSALKRKADGAPSPWKTPKKGKSCNFDGYVVLVGQDMVSQSNNPMFDILVQRAQSDVVMVRVMTQKVIEKDKFLSAVGDETKMLQLKNVCECDGFYFFNPSSGSSHQFILTQLNFAPEKYRKFTTELNETNINGKKYVECRIKYLSPVKNAKNGSPIRNAALYDEASEMLMTIWNPALFHLNEDKMYYITDIDTEDYFGIKLKTSNHTIVMESDGELIQEISKERFMPLRIRAMGVVNTTDVSVEGIMMADIESVILCPSKKCFPRGKILPPPQGSIGKCSNGECNGRVNTLLAKPEISGSITLPNDDTLSVNEMAIDNVFGDGVANLYKNDPDQIANKFLELTNVTISYDKKTMMLVSAQQ